MTVNRSSLGAAWAPSANRQSGRQPLTREQIVQGAIEFLRERPLEELTMRRLASYLGTAATSLYWHVANKEQLLDRVLDEIFGEVRLPPPGDEWEQDIRAVSRDLRRALRTLGSAASIVVSRPIIGPRALMVIEYLLATLRRGGLSDAEIPFVYDLLANYVIGSVLVESSWLGSVQDAEPQARTDDISDYMATLPGADYPTLVELAPTLFSHGEDEKFEFGLDRLLDGIARDIR